LKYHANLLYIALFEYLFRQSGGPFEVTRTAAAVGITRPTVESHLRALEITNAVTLVRPFPGSGQNGLVKQPALSLNLLRSADWIRSVKGFDYACLHNDGR
jgi:DNA-binding transcriptional ArsR family regulator